MERRVPWHGLMLMRRKLLAGCRGDDTADGAQPLLPAVAGCNEHLFMIHTSHKNGWLPLSDAYGIGCEELE